MRREASIVLADDDEVGRYVIATMLRRSGFDVQEVDTGEQALAAIEHTAPDLAILDVRMPGIGGFEACRRIRADERTNALPVLMLSATFVETDARVEGLELGADAYLTQPVEAPVLAATVRALLRARRAEHDVHVAAHQWQATFDSIRDGVAVLDAAGRLQRVNQAFAALYRAKAADLVGRDVATLDPPIHPAAVPADLELGGRVHALRMHEATLGPSTEGQPGSWVLTVTDVTAERLADAARADLLAREQQISSTLQNALLPERLPLLPGVVTVGWHRTAERDLVIGGDWYDIIETTSGSWLVIGDIAGHGIHAAAAAGSLRHSLRVYAREGYDLLDAVRGLNGITAATGGMATMCIVEIDRAATRLRYVRAGHPPPLFLPADGEPRLLRETAGTVLGTGDLPHEVATERFATGDRVVLYTDGLVERRGESLDVGLARLAEAGSQVADHDLETARAMIVGQLVDVGDLGDDVALLLAERT